jgi:hypothetical protein
METVVMAITAAADKTTAAFFMGFPFTKIKRQAKAFCRLNPVTLCPLLVPSRRPNHSRDGSDSVHHTSRPSRATCASRYHRRKRTWTSSLTCCAIGVAAADKRVTGAAIAGTPSNIAPITRSAAGLLSLDMTFLQFATSDHNQLG